MGECVSSRPFLSLPPSIPPYIAFQTMAKKKFAAKHEARIETETKRKEKELNIYVYFYNNIEQIVGAYA